MSTSEPDFNPEDYEGLQPRQAAIHPAELRKLRKEAEENKANKAKIVEFERREVFGRAGVPVDDPGARYFIKGYDGELTPEAIKAAAIEARIMTAQGATPAEVAGHQAAQAAAAGGTPPTAGPDYAAKLAELSKKQFAPADDVARQAHIAEIIRLGNEASQGKAIPLYPT